MQKSRPFFDDGLGMKLFGLLFFSFFVWRGFGYAHIHVPFKVSNLSTLSLLEKALPALSGDYKNEGLEIDLSGVELVSGARVEKGSLDYLMNLNFTKVTQKTLEGDLKMESLKLNFENFNFTDVQVIKIPGVNATVTTKVECSFLPVSVKNLSSKLKTNLNLGKDLSVSNTDVSFDFSNMLLDVDVSKCNAPAGIDLVFKKEFSNYLTSLEGQNFITGFLEDYINEQIEVYKRDLFGRGFEFEVFKLKAKLFIDDLNIGEKLSVFGEVMLISDVNKRFALNPNTHLKEGLSNIVFPKKALRYLAPQIVKTQLFNIDLNRKNIPGIDRLFKSRLLQFFAWRDLTNFSKKIDFNLNADIKPKKLYSHTYKIDTDYVFYIDAELKGDMDFLSKSNKKKLPYLNIFADLNAKVGVDLKSEGLDLVLDNLFVRSKSLSWDAEMSQWRRSKARGKPRFKLLWPEIKKSLDGERFSYSWADLGVEDYVKIKSLDQSGSSMSIDFLVSEKVWDLILPEKL